jgi:hypothetical protein
MIGVPPNYLNLTDEYRTHIKKTYDIPVQCQPKHLMQSQDSQAWSYPTLWQKFQAAGQGVLLNTGNRIEIRGQNYVKKALTNALCDEQ